MTLDSYQELRKELKDISLLGNASSILGWDMKTYMPKAGIEQRGAQLAMISTIIHEKFTSPKIGKLLLNCTNIPDLSPLQKRNLELWQRDYEKSTKLPTELVAEMSRQEALTENLWETAKAKSDFSLVLPELEKLYLLIQKKAEYLDPQKDPYDVMLDLFEPQITAAQISALFEPLRNGVIKLVQDLKRRPVPSNKILQHPITFAQQERISQFAIELVGLDPMRSRLDESEHPFTTGYADDVRITTHYLDNDPLASFYSVLHEAGHALYELNLPREYIWTAVGNSISLGIHESQSRFIENMIGKNPLFLEFFYSKLKEIIPGYNPGQQVEFIKAINAVTPSKIRIYADEVTYNLHIILRFELERDLFAGKITLKEMPEAWNSKMESYLGQKIVEDKEGVLQDTHWYGGAFGYFPDYVLGNIYDGQLLNTINKDAPTWSDGLIKGNISTIRDWLAKNVHSQGSLYDPFDLIQHVTGEKPSEQYFLQYLNEKFRPLFGI